MKTIIAMMLAAAFLVSRPALAGDEAPKSEKTTKKSDKKSDKKDPAPEGEKKPEKGGW